MIRYFLLFGLVLLAWIIFSGHMTLINLLIGAIVSVMTLVLSTQLLYRRLEKQPLPYVFFWRVPVYFGWLLKEIILSGVRVVYVVWQPTLNISPTLSWIPCRLRQDIGLTLYANSITLTPGTVAVIVREGKMLVHALSDNFIKDLSHGEMETHIVHCLEKKQ